MVNQVEQQRRNRHMKTKALLLTLALISLIAPAATAQVTVSTVTTNTLLEPWGLAIDAQQNLYISDSAHNRIVKVDVNSQLASTLAGIPWEPEGSEDGPSYLAHFNNPQGLVKVSIAGEEGLVVADSGNHLIRFVRLTDGYVTTLAGQIEGGPAFDAAGREATFRYPAGLEVDDLGNVYIADWGNNVIRVMSVNSTGDLVGVTNLVVAGTSFFRPSAVAFAGTNPNGQRQIWVADTGNQLIKLITLSSPTVGTVTTTLGGYRVQGDIDSSFGGSARFNYPRGLVYVPGLGLLISDTLNHSIRLAVSNPLPTMGATNYSVTTYAGSSGKQGYVDGEGVASRFNSPSGILFDSVNDVIAVADLGNNALRRIQTGPALPPVTTPEVGIIIYVYDPTTGLWLSQLDPVTSRVFNNTVEIGIRGDSTATYYNDGAASLASSVMDPTVNSRQAPAYSDGWTPEMVNRFPQVSSVLGLPRAGLEQLTIKARGIRRGQQPSPVVTAKFQFQTATPNLIGNNAYTFTVSGVTSNSIIYYTTDGTTPTTNSSSLVLNPTTYAGSFSSNNFPFVFFAHREGFLDSPIVSNYFSEAEFVPNRISLGFENGEASSRFVASPGQRFYAPVTLSTLPATRIYSLQFNVAVTNAGPGPQVSPGAIGFESTLVKPDPLNPGAYITIPTAMFLTEIVNPQPEPPPGNKVFPYNLGWFQDLRFVNTSLNLLGVGWLERQNAENLYNTKIQDLIKYSQPHDHQFLEDGGKVVLGGYWFQVPSNAARGQRYTVRIGQPSATSDGVAESVFIETPVKGALLAVQDVVVGSADYLAGDAAPFRWFNAGEFGDNKLENNDVMQAFQTGVYGVNAPLPGSDLFDSLDSSGYMYVDRGNGYLEADPSQTINRNALFNGNDTDINRIAFGDGVIDVCDVYVTFRRSLDPSLTWFRRFWTNGVRAARFDLARPVPPASSLSPVLSRPVVSFSAADAAAQAGQTLEIPIKAEIEGTNVLRVAMLKLSVQPLDGSPALAEPVAFAPGADLGQPTFAAAYGKSGIGAAWLKKGTTAITGKTTLGTLTVRVPQGAGAAAAYAVRFEHASASPNGLAAFESKSASTIITLSDRSVSSYGDAIPDSWRLRHFGTVQNLLSQAGADADGDGADNLQEYQAGTDPVNPASCLRLAAGKVSATVSGQPRVRWPSVAGKTYVVERCGDLFTQSWTPLSTRTGTGAELEFLDTAVAGPCFYRVRVAP
jgi:sugar lactone lactonase YvrE